MKSYLKFYILPLLYGIFFSLYFKSNGNEKIDIFSFIATLGHVDIPNFTKECVPIVILDVFIFYMFIIVFSTYMYRNFTCSSVYIFSRCESRIKWYLKECMKLFICTLLNTIAVLLGYFITCSFRYGVTYTKESIRLMCIFIIMNTLIMFACVLISNIFSIVFNNVIGIMVSLGLILLFILALLTVNYYSITRINKIKIYMNPISYTMIGWYKTIEKYTCIDRESMPYLVSEYRGGIVCGLFCLLVLVGGLIVIQRIDILNNKEN